MVLETTWLLDKTHRRGIGYELGDSCRCGRFGVAPPVVLGCHLDEPHPGGCRTRPRNGHHGIRWLRTQDRDASTGHHGHLLGGNGLDRVAENVAVIESDGRDNRDDVVTVEGVGRIDTAADSGLHDKPVGFGTTGEYVGHRCGHCEEGRPLVEMFGRNANLGGCFGHRRPAWEIVGDREPLSDVVHVRREVESDRVATASKRVGNEAGSGSLACGAYHVNSSDPILRLAQCAEQRSCCGARDLTTGRVSPNKRRQPCLDRL